MKSSRGRAREFTLHGLYQWQLGGDDPALIAAQLAEEPGFARIDRDYFRTLFYRIVESSDDLKSRLQPFLDRAVAMLDPIERAILLIGVAELVHQPEVPLRVVINEAIELAKAYGGTDGHKYVNGVLDKLAGTLRPNEERRPAAR